ncbi:YIP1 family protein [Desmospora profundinema]|uniref:Yip1 domain-containing protein n=1 Tax=Desmospora profundinema TaxID=1571184 RepID=A0ABU1IQF2_9BACL|nr:YIP1 family protein [Desmospora profundinema]MDR6227015.1 hypothetical protein [Desmospora profundinema]
MEIQIQPEQSRSDGRKSSVWGVLTDPYTQFGRIKRDPRIWSPLLVVILLSIVFTGIQGYVISQQVPLDNEVLEGIEQNSFDQFVFIFSIVGAVFGGTVTPLFAILVISLVQWLLVKLFSSEVGFRPLFSLNAHLHILAVLALGVNATSGWLLGLSVEVQMTSLAVFLSTEHGVVRNLLSQVELFAIWKWILTAGGLAVVAGLTRKQGWTVVGIIIALSLSLAALFGWVETFMEEMVPVQ